MGKNFIQHDPSDHHPGCMKGIFYHFHNRGMNYARKKLTPRRTTTNGKWIAVDDDDGSSIPSSGSGEDREKCDSKMDGSAVEAKGSESGSVNKKSVKARIKSLISEEVSKRTGRHKRSSSCPVQTQSSQNNPTHQDGPIHHVEPLDKSNVRVNEDITARSSPKAQEEEDTSRNPCNVCAAMSTMNYLRQSEVNDKGKRPVEDHTLLQDKSIHATEPRRIAPIEESRMFLDALDLLNMRKELFLKVLRDPGSSLAQKLHEKKLSKSRGRLTKSMSFPSPRLEAKDVNRKLESHYSMHGDTMLLRNIKDSSAGKPNDRSMSFRECLEEATPEQPQRQPNNTGNVSPNSGLHLNNQQNKVVIKRFKNLGEKIKHAIKESRKDRQHIMKDAVLHRIPRGKKSKGYNGQGDTNEKPSKIYMKNNLEQKGFTRASSFNDSFEKYNRLLESDGGREAKGKELERDKLKTNVTPTPIKSIPKSLNRIYSSPDLGLYHGFQSLESPDSNWCDTSITSTWVDCSSNEKNVISGKQKCLESNSTTKSPDQMVKMLNCESQENFLASGEGLDTMSKSENIEDAGKDLDRISKCDDQEKTEDADELLDKRSKCESQENFVDSGEGLDKIQKCEIQENIVDAGEGLDRISKNGSRENFVDVEDAGEGSDRISKCESRQNFVDAGEGLDTISRCDGPENIEDIDSDFDNTGDLKRRNSASNIDIIADKPILDIAYDSSYQEDDTDPAKYSLQDDRLVVEHLSLDGEYRLASQQHESSRDGTTVYEKERGSSATSRLYFDYVKGVLDLSGFNRNEFLGNWHSPGQAVDPAVLDEVKDILLVQTELSEIDGTSCDHILLFDLVNEVLLDIYHKSSSYWPKPLSFRSSIHPMPMGYHVLEEVWADINCYLQWKPTSDQAYIDDGDAVAQDFAKYDGWMNLQFDSECVGLELEDLLFDDLLEELLSDIKN